MSIVLNGTTGISNGAGTGVAIAQPSFWVRKTTNTAYNVGVILWDSVVYNVGSGYSSSTGRFTAPVAGTYFFTSCVGRYDPAAADIYQYWRKNGAQVGSGFDPANNSSTGQYHYFTNCAIITLAVNDYVDYYFSGGAGTCGSVSGSYFCGYLIG